MRIFVLEIKLVIFQIVPQHFVILLLKRVCADALFHYQSNS